MTGASKSAVLESLRLIMTNKSVWWRSPEQTVIEKAFAAALYMLVDEIEVKP